MVFVCGFGGVVICVYIFKFEDLNIDVFVGFVLRDWYESEDLIRV